MFGRTAKVLALAGAMAASAAAAPAEELDICARLSAAEVARVLGTPVALAEPDTDVGSRSCVYSLTKDGPNVVVTQLAGDWEAIRSEFQTSAPEPVAGVGRQAFWYSEDHALQVQADSGTVLRIGFSPRDAEIGGEHKAVAVDLARAALIALR